jgi:hypothetical protein
LALGWHVKKLCSLEEVKRMLPEGAGTLPAVSDLCDGAKLATLTEGAALSQ